MQQKMFSVKKKKKTKLFKHWLNYHHLRSCEYCIKNKPDSQRKTIEWVTEKSQHRTKSQVIIRKKGIKTYTSPKFPLRGQKLLSTLCRGAKKRQIDLALDGCNPL